MILPSRLGLVTLTNFVFLDVGRSQEAEPPGSSSQAPAWELGGEVESALVGGGFKVGDRCEYRS